MFHRIYWAFKTTLVIAAIALIYIEASPVAGAFTGAVNEYVYGIAIFVMIKSHANQQVFEVCIHIVSNNGFLK